MHFTSAAALVALSSIGVTYAAPLANSQDDLIRRKSEYEVVNVGGEPSSSAVPEVETVTQTLNSVVTAAGVPAVPSTVTITATQSPTLSPSSVAPSSTPHAHHAPPLGGSFMPPMDSSSFFRRGLKAAGDPFLYARSLAPSSSSWPVSATPLVARDFDAWYPSSSVATSTLSAVSSTSLVARQWGGWSSSIALPSSATPSVSATPLAARDFDDESFSSGLSTASSTLSVNASASPTPFARRAIPSTSSVATPSSSWSLPAAASLLPY
ncbi:hypothetical protein N7533_007055 [Penicillium manginii]|uniref:uncharacterized protein n=1 Tax=Penicillium manginii TaxID=203109 RepID=UPI002546C4FA|nr:uncharacterized protein N7533_007055 [Penicillium manginii]KAJ5750027.1 hypothetical protein N7533_007055 [Penicillium manginii]